MEENNKLKRFDNEALPAFFKDLSEEQQKTYLDKLASDNADLKRIASEKVIQSKVAEHDMTNDLEFLKQIKEDDKIAIEELGRMANNGQKLMDNFFNSGQIIQNQEEVIHNLEEIIKYHEEKVGVKFCEGLSVSI